MIMSLASVCSCTKLRIRSNHFSDTEKIHPDLTSLFGDQIWHLRGIIENASANDCNTRLDFALWDHGDVEASLFLREFAYNCLNFSLRGSGTQLRLLAPISVPITVRIAATFRTFIHTELRKNLQDVEREDGVVFLRRYADKGASSEHLNKVMGIIRRIGLYAGRITEPVYQGDIFDGATVRQLTGVAPQRRSENETPRIPEGVIAPLIKWAQFFIEHVAKDVIRAAAEDDARDRSTAAWQAETARREGKARVQQLIDTDLENRQRIGAALPQTITTRRNGQIECGGINLAAYARELGVPSRHVNRMGVEIATEAERRGIDLTPIHYRTPPSYVPGTGIAWTVGFDRKTVSDGAKFVQTACYILVAYFSGMRDSEVQNLQIGCIERVVDALTGQATRYLIRGTASKGNAGQRAPHTWVTVETAGKAVEVLEALLPVFGAGPQLFGKISNLWEGKEPGIKSHLNNYLQRFINMCQEIAIRLATEARTDDELRIARNLSFSKEWRLGSRQFRRTIAWYIANRPFGVVAGMIQYGHLSHITFEGYAGTSHSGFRAEVEREQALARLGDIVELYEDYKRGVLPSGGKAPTVLAEFEFVDRALAQEGAEVVSEQRLRRMLANLATHLYPGIYSHCFFNAETALCLERLERKDQPVLANCDELVCANACRWKAHAPAISDAISEIRELKAKRGISPTQRTILEEQMRRFQALLEPIRRTEP